MIMGATSASWSSEFGATQRKIAATWTLKASTASKMLWHLPIGCPSYRSVMVNSRVALICAARVLYRASAEGISHLVSFLATENSRTSFYSNK
jgi:hypothetical protein